MDLPTAHLMARKIGFKQRTISHDQRGDALEQDRHAAADMALAKRIGHTLEAHYPDHPWMVEVDHRQGVVMLSLPIVMPRNQKFIVHLSTIATDPTLRCIVRAGGEILERHNVPRSGFRLDPFLEARAKAPHNQRRARFIIPD